MMTHDGLLVAKFQKRAKGEFVNCYRLGDQQV